MKITDEMIVQYCKSMGYGLIKIGRIAFEYRKPDGSESALLKAAAAPNKSFHSDAEIDADCDCFEKSCIDCEGDCPTISRAQVN